MKLHIFKIALIAILSLSIFSGCVDDQQYDVPNADVETFDLVANKTVAEIIATPTGTTNAYVNDDIIEAYVTSSDESGNFFNTICFQTLEVNNIVPRAFSVSVEMKAFAQGFTPGRKVYIKMKGLYSAMVDGSLKIGGRFESAPNQFEVGRISAFDWNKHLFPSATIVPESDLVRTVTLAQAVTDANLNSLLEINNVQFADDSLSRFLYDVNSGGFATNHNIVDIAGGRPRVLRISSFSLLKGMTVPTGRGRIRGIMTKFGSTYQFIVRYESDFKLTDPRNYNFVSTLNENFNSYPGTSGNFSILTSTYAFANYINVNAEGEKKWFVKGNGPNNTLEMSSFFTNENNKCYFMVPVNMTAANNLAFKVSVNFATNRLGLKVYRAMNYIPGTKVNTSTFFDITSSFPIPFATTTNLQLNYAIPTSVTGNGFFVFEYSGTSLVGSVPVTTSINLDDIVVN